MQHIFSLKTLQLGFHFYKKFLLTSLLITFGFLFLKMPLSLMITLKFLLFGILVIVHEQPSLKQKLIFYKNFGISSIILFITVFVFDTLATVSIVLIPIQF